VEDASVDLSVVVVLGFLLVVDELGANASLDARVRIVKIGSFHMLQ